ncbi:uracil-DNA glycosylase family protein [Paenibacillus sp. GCM10028914]|uniref:uracil-DNA glycosylase family protein n=1 Tax=Paenibacillus sp. GCM10028914 TaxID=3273416 RepID=UPI00360D4E69
MLISNYLDQYKHALRSLPKDRMLAKEDLLVDDLLMARSGKLEMYYAPHNEYINPSARVMIIGLTPGLTQMRTAIQAAKVVMDKGLSDEEICRTAKEAARFAGTMRSNLIDMLNGIGLDRYLNISSCDELFRDQQKLLHTTSLLGFPVFVEKNNYSGTHPNLLSNPFLKQTALASICEELDHIKPVLLIPLGKIVESVLHHLVAAGKLNADQCLWGFPHPSGANGHRHKQFAYHQDQMKEKIKSLSLK